MKRSAKSRDPYESGMIAARPDFPRSPLTGVFVAVLVANRDARGLELIHPRTRCIRRHDIHELIMTDEAEAAPGGRVQRTSYIGFVEFTGGGVLGQGDQVVIGDTVVGEVVGFDETHMPNHLNLVFHGP